MDGRDTQARWVMEDQKAGTVLEFDELRGYGFILEDGTADEVFVKRRAVKRLSEPNWRHNLKRGERVTYAKSKGRKGYWAAGVQRIEKSTSTNHPRNPQGSAATYSEPFPSASAAPSRPPGNRSPVTGSVYVEGNATIQLTNNEHRCALVTRERPPLRPIGAITNGSNSSRLCSDVVPAGPRHY